MDECPIILVVDDEATHRAILFDYLDRQGYRVLLAEDGESAVEICKLIEPNIILLDIMLPGMDGYETCRRIKVHEQRSDVVILFMSGLDDGASRSAIFKAGGNAHLLKPPVPIEVTTLIEQHLEGQKNKRRLRESDKHSPRLGEEMNRIIDYVAHDMKTPLLGALGFAEELTEEFKENDSNEEWKEYAQLIHSSAKNADEILDALVLLKNLLQIQEPSFSEVSISKIFLGACNRYGTREGSRPISNTPTLPEIEVQTNPTLFEELLLTILRILDQLTHDSSELELEIYCDTVAPETVGLSIDAKTRPLTKEEGPRILEPITAEGRKKVNGTDISTVCAQKLIEILKLETETQVTDEGVRFQFHLKSAQPSLFE